MAMSALLENADPLAFAIKRELVRIAIDYCAELARTTSGRNFERVHEDLRERIGSIVDQFHHGMQLQNTFLRSEVVRLRNITIEQLMVELPLVE
jgi:hypothetical protein